MSAHLYTQLSRYTQPILIVFGTIGAVLNQILFRRRKLLRTASCSLYFRVLSINDLLVLYIIVLGQWLIDQFHIDLTSKSNVYCKTRIYATYCLYAISPYCVVLVCVDRYCRTSKYTRIRTFATLRTAHRVVVFIVVGVLLVYIHVPIQYTTIDAVCRPANPTYYRFLGYFLFVFYCLLPPILMSVFCSLTCLSLRMHRAKQKHKYRIHTKRRLYRDYQLLKILLLYVTSNIVCTLPFSVLLLIDVNRWSSNVHLMQYIQCSILLCNLNHCTSFYIYTLGTPLYRRELLRLIRPMRRHIMLTLCSSSASHSSPTSAKGDRRCPTRSNYT